MTFSERAAGLLFNCAQCTVERMSEHDELLRDLRIQRMAQAHKSVRAVAEELQGIVSTGMVQNNIVRERKGAGTDGDYGWVVHNDGTVHPGVALDWSIGRDGKVRPDRRLDTSQRDAFIRALHERAGWSMRAIAAQVGCSVGTVHRVVKGPA